MQDKKFRMLMGGEEVAQAPDAHLDVVIVKMAHTVTRTYYEGSYQVGKITSPVCWSHDGKTPAKEIPVAQAKSCYQCTHSVRGSGNNGVGTACKLSWRLAVVLANDISGEILQLVLSSMSCFGKESNGRYPFRPYIQMLANNNISAGRVITRLQFDEGTNIPKLLLSPIAAIEEKDLKDLKIKSTSQDAENAITLTVAQNNYNEDRPTVQFDVFLEKPYEQSEADKNRDKDVTDIIDKWVNKK